MALKKEDKVRLEGLQNTFAMLVSNGLHYSQIDTMMAPQLKEFESITGSKIRTHYGENHRLEVLDLSKDFIRVRLPNEESRVLRAKVQAVPIDVKLFKADDYDFSNEDVVSALRALADEVEGLDFELNSLVSSDVRKEKEKHQEQMLGSDAHEDTHDIDVATDVGSEDQNEMLEGISDDQDRSLGMQTNFISQE